MNINLSKDNYIRGIASGPNLKQDFLIKKAAFIQAASVKSNSVTGVQGQYIQSLEPLVDSQHPEWPSFLWHHSEP